MVVVMNTLYQFTKLSHQVFFVIIIGVFALRQAIPHFEKLVSAAGSSVQIYKIIDEVWGQQTNKLHAVIDNDLHIVDSSSFCGFSQ